VAFGIPPPLWEEVCKPLDRGGIFVISDEILSRIKKMNIRKNDENNIKMISCMIGYLTELTYDLCLGIDDNVSENPGFEIPLKIFSNTE